MNWLDTLQKRILAAGILLSLVLAGGVLLNANAVALGREITVPARGFDPRDFLAGHYVRLSYDFSTPASAPDCANKKGAIVWTGIIAPSGKNDVINAAYMCDRTDLPADSVAIKGKSTGYSRLEFGVERFYATQKDATRIENALRGFNPDAPAEKQPPVYAVLSVGADGQARLKALLLGDERIDLSWL